jgi:SAM-dependent methyltransferase
MKPISPEGFEQRFRNDIDPWNYRTSRFEAFKRSVLIRACGFRAFGRALELACAIGENTRVLAPRCLRLLSIDSSPTALAEAIRRNEGAAGVTFRRVLLPREMPRGPYDLIVASEIAYYLPWQALDDLLRRIFEAAAPGARIVFLHHLRPFDDAAVLPHLAQARIVSAFNRSTRRVFHERHARFDAVAFQKPLMASWRSGIRRAQKAVSRKRA